MALVIEDGSGVSGADSYVTLAEYATYAEAHGWTLADTDDANEINLRRAATYLDRKPVWSGYRAKEAQPLKWPRRQIGYVDGYWVDSDEIPADIKSAQLEVAYLLQGGLDPFATVTVSKTRERKKVGPIETEVETLPTGTARLVAVEGLLRPYLKAGTGQLSLARG